LTTRGEQVLVPSPALAEVLATPGYDMEQVLSTLPGVGFIRIGDFDQRAAVELARLRAAVAKGDVREGLKTTRTKMSSTGRSWRSPSRTWIRVRTSRTRPRPVQRSPLIKQP
jgi:hypothetical protein